MFKVPIEERDFLIEADPETFFTTDHHRPWPLVLARPERLDPGWARANIERVWRAQVEEAHAQGLRAAGTLSVDELALDARDRLPDALRVLVERISRARLGGAPALHRLTRFWLDRHLCSAGCRACWWPRPRAFLDREREPRGYGGGLARLAGQYPRTSCTATTPSRTMHYFPLLKALDAAPRRRASTCSTPTTTRSTRAIHGLAEATNAVLAALRDGAPAEAAPDALRRGWPASGACSTAT